jgi:hypothetical protein
MKDDATRKNTANAKKDEDGEKKVLAVGGAGTVLYANPRKEYFAPKFNNPPVIDGNISDEAWKAVPRAGGFMKLGLEHPYVDNQTTVQAGWDEKALYLLITCFENNMSNIKTTATGSDSAPYFDDAVELFLAPVKGNLKEYYQFICNGGDGYFEGKGMDKSWNGSWTWKAKKGADRWFVEIAVPFSSLGVAVPSEGTIWSWLVARDRQAGGGADALSALPEMTGGWHSPDEYDKLIFTDKPLDVSATEAQLNSGHIESTKNDIISRENAAVAELAVGRKLLSKIKSSENTAVTNAKEDIDNQVKIFKELISDIKPNLEKWNQARLGFKNFDNCLKKYCDAVGKLGYSGVSEVPNGLPSGISLKDTYAFISGGEITAVVDTSSGVICGIFDKSKRRVMDWSFDSYYVKTASSIRKTDERMDEKSSLEIEPGGSLKISYRNPDLGCAIVKRYSLVSATPDGAKRILSKEVSISGNPPEKTLLVLTSRTRFNDGFKSNAYYHRVKTAGTMGDPRCIIPANDITNPIMLHFSFNTGAASILCAVDKAKNNGIGQYFFKADGKWVMPRGMDLVKSFFNDTGWELSWLGTFISQEPHSGEIRYHLFEGDHTVFHQEYRDLPERLAAVDAIPVAPQAIHRKFNLNLGVDEDITDTKTRKGQIFQRLYPRLRSKEYSSLFAMEHNDLWHGDYPVGDDALLHVDYPPNSKTYPAIKVKQRLEEQGKIFPRIMSGWYHTPQNICFHSGLAKEHPEWLMLGSDGKPIPSGWNPYFGIGNFSDAYSDEIVHRLCAQMDYYGEKLMYVDYTILSPAADWSSGRVVNGYAHIRFLTNLYREVRKRGGLLWLNAGTFDGIHDIGFWEGFNKHDNWRAISDSFLMRNIYDRKGMRTIPLQWIDGETWGKDGCNYRDYTNLLLSHLLVPTECFEAPFTKFKDSKTGKIDWGAVVAHTVAYHEFASEVGWNRFKEVGLEPAWWRNEQTNLEVNVFTKEGNSFIITALSHVPLTEPTRNTMLSMDFTKLGFNPGYETFVWQFIPRDPDKFPRHGGSQPENWDKLFAKRYCRIIEPANGRLPVAIDSLEPFLTRIASATQVPAVFAKLEKLPTQTLLPELLDCKIEGHKEKGKDSYSLKVSSIYQAEILLYRPNDKVKVFINNSQVEPISEFAGDFPVLRVSVPEGKSAIEVK